MQPNQKPYIPYPSTQLIYTPEQIAAIRRSNTLKLRWGLICLIAPTALLIVTIIIFAIGNFISSSVTPTPNISDSVEPVGLSPSHPIVNILLFLIGSISTLTWLPGIIVGIILLATRKKIS
ncbi:hypothetical protein EOL96_05570 [Candidatus Saccharibacteria bacterium]|nr:hypothetical protein [Candidatus Saccharibacteria bacterium]